MAVADSAAGRDGFEIDYLCAKLHCGDEINARFVDLFRGIKPVERDSETHHIIVLFEFFDCRRVAQMLYRYIYTSLFELIYKQIEALRLEKRRCFHELIGAGVVAENTLKDEIRELDYLLYLLHALVVILKADTRHTGVESDMEPNGLSEGNRPIRQALCHIIGIDILRYIIVYKQIVLRGRSITENEDRLFYTCAAKLDRLFYNGDAEIIDLALKLMRKLDRAVAVAVRFDNRENLCPLGYTAFALTEIVKNRVYIYPCIYTMILHRYRFLCQIIWASGAVSIPFALSSAFIRFANSTALTPSP